MNAGDYRRASDEPQGDRQTTRLIRCECGGCGCVFRMARKWLVEPLNCPQPECDGYVETDA